MKKLSLIWVIYFITSFAAFHYGMVAFGYDLLKLSFVTPALAQAGMILFGICGLMSLIMLLMPCKSECCKK